MLTLTVSILTYAKGVTSGPLTLPIKVGMLWLFRQSPFNIKEKNALPGFYHEGLWWRIRESNADAYGQHPDLRQRRNVRTLDPPDQGWYALAFSPVTFQY
jgi:hypothetical protein